MGKFTCLELRCTEMRAGRPASLCSSSRSRFVVVAVLVALLLARGSSLLHCVRLFCKLALPSEKAQLGARQAQRGIGAAVALLTAAEGPLPPNARTVARRSSDRMVEQANELMNSIMND